MKFLFPAATVSLLLASLPLLGSAALAQQPRFISQNKFSGPKTFSCDIRPAPGNSKRAVPTTLARDSRGEVVVYYWTRSYYSDLGEDALTRCTRVASILDSFNRRGILATIKAGQMNGRSVICVADSGRGPCTRLVFPLEANENPAQVLADLRNALAGAAPASRTQGGAVR